MCVMRLTQALNAEQTYKTAISEANRRVKALDQNKVMIGFKTHCVFIRFLCHQIKQYFITTLLLIYVYRRKAHGRAELLADFKADNASSIMTAGQLLITRKNDSYLRLAGDSKSASSISSRFHLSLQFKFDFKCVEKNYFHFLYLLVNFFGASLR